MATDRPSLHAPCLSANSHTLADSAPGWLRVNGGRPTSSAEPLSWRRFAWSGTRTPLGQEGHRELNKARPRSAGNDPAAAGSRSKKPRRLRHRLDVVPRILPERAASQASPSESTQVLGALGDGHDRDRRGTGADRARLVVARSRREQHLLLRDRVRRRRRTRPTG